MEEVVVIVGAGPSGLATSACLNLLSIPNLILERENCYASLWKNRAYDRLKLHLAKQFCHLPHMPHPPSAPKFIPRLDFIRYIDDYVSTFNIKPSYNRSVESAIYDGLDKKWRIEVNNTVTGENELYMAKFLVIATGENSKEFIPQIPGLESFGGKIVHSSQYKSGAEFKQKKVLVVGCGNSGMEIAYDLSNFGACTSIVVRSPVLPEVSRIEKNYVAFNNDEIHQFDSIIFATGYRSTANNWLKDHDSLLGKNGMPKNRFPNHWKGANGLYCAGLSRRGLAGVSMDAEAIANDIKFILTGDLQET
ncbi:Pyridine nucleotide-disulfide oxidoreductase [Macleaya cordata]|uniref:indole-3-pyruvate monooxygenase n=1 Tax=Macleaya cordata TaxID=56857 RepID=A0A200R106_MACCD|nr:Pyridine nucleotide-disulfide oxidoreductase [Macleaya cordata]